MIPYDTLYRDYPPSWRDWKRRIGYVLALLAWCGVAIGGGFLMLEWAMEAMYVG